MRTSNVSGETTRQRPITPLAPTSVVAREAIIAAVLVTGLMAVVAPADFGGSLNPHPGWVVVFLLAARYGSRGLALALAATGGTLAVAAVCVGNGLGIANASLAAPVDRTALAGLGAATASAANVGALTLSVLVAWVASLHERRTTGLVRQVSELAQHHSEETASLARLKDAVGEVRARADRLEHSISFLRHAADRLEGRDPVAGAEAALDLAMARSGARAGMVQLVERGQLRTIAWRGAWSETSPVPPDLMMMDRTASTAMANAAMVRSADVAGAGPDDSDIATPIRNLAGDFIGVMALRGVALDSMGAAGPHDIELIASWCGKSLRAERAERRTRSTDVAHAVLATLSAVDALPLLRIVR